MRPANDPVCGIACRAPDIGVALVAHAVSLSAVAVQSFVTGKHLGFGARAAQVAGAEAAWS